MPIQTIKELRDQIRQYFAADWRRPIRSGFIYIKKKDIKDAETPMKLNMVQRRLMQFIWDLEQQQVPVRILVPKARQHGISTFIEAMIYSKTAFQKNTNAIIIADDKSHARIIFDMAKLMHKKMAKLFKTETHKTNAQEVVFSENDSQIVVATDARSGMFHIFHSSETAFYRNAEETMLGVLQCIPDKPGTMVIMESTGNGYNYFSDMVMRAKAGKNDYHVFFIPWYENPEYAIKASKDFEAQESGAYGNEIYYRDTYKLSNEQLAWRRYTIDDKCKGDLQTFKQEYPACVEECFQGSGSPVFDHSLISEMQKDIALPELYGWVEEDDLVFSKSKQGYIKIWARPDTNLYQHRYVIGADTGGMWEGADYSCAYVYDRVLRCVVACIHGHFDAYVYAKYLIMLAKWYHNARIAVEVNKWASEADEMGNTVIDNILKRYKYTNFYTHQVIDDLTKQMTTKVGWHTGSENKQLLVDRLREFVNDYHKEPIGFNDAELLGEMLTYVISQTKKGKATWEASEGHKDDRVMSFGITLCVAREMPKPTIRKKAEAIVSSDSLLEKI